jgi:DNA modification methylase
VTEPARPPDNAPSPPEALFALRPSAHVIRGNALNLPLADSSVDLIVTSPPYFGLRSYTDGGEHYAGQIGSEATPAEFVDALIAATREMVRVLKPSGSIFVNLGDKYAGGGGNYPGTGDGLPHGSRLSGTYRKSGRTPAGMTAKSLMGIPWRYTLRCIDDLGLILRAEVIWSKPNGLPESVTDRVRRSHEQWFHFVTQPRYFSAVDEIREEHTGPPPSHFGRITKNQWKDDPAGLARTKGVIPVGTTREYNPLGKLPGSVWTIPTQPLKVPPELGVDHFAAFPMEWPRRIIQGWSPAGICTGCGEGRRPVRGYDREPEYTEVEDRRINERVMVEWCRTFAGWCDSKDIRRKELDAAAGTSDMGGWWASRLAHRCAVPTKEQYARLAAAWPDIPEHPGPDLWEPFTRRVAWSFGISAEGAAVQGRHRHNMEPTKLSTTITGYACACPEPSAPTRPAVILDPFGGTGTTALVAKALGRIGISVDLSQDYCRLAQWRTTDPGQLADALQIEKPDVIPDDQLSLLDYAAEVS